MTSRLRAALTAAGLTAFGAVIVSAQGRGGAEWTTGGYDAQRTAWIRSDPRISLETMQKPGEFGPFKSLWKLKLEHDPQAAGTLTEPVLLDRLIGFRGFKSIAFVATASETVHAIDSDFGVPLWKYHINYSASPPPVLIPTPECPGGLTAAVSRPTSVYPVTGGGGGRGGRSGGGVGEPGRGATTLAGLPPGRGDGAPAPARGATPGAVPGSAAAAAGSQPGGLPGAARGGGGGGGAAGAFVPGADAAYVVGSDGYLHALNVSNGWDNMTPALFLPANTRATGLVIATVPDEGAVAYAATTNGCGSQPDAVWAMDLASPQKTVVAFKAGGATIAGASAPALGRDGTVFVATRAGAASMASSVIALEPKTLQLKASAAVPKADFSSSPLVFQSKDRDLVTVAGSGTLYLFDPAALKGGPVATASFGTAKSNPDALVSWIDGAGTPWIGVPTERGVATFKVHELSGKIALEAAWTTRPIAAPLKPLVINGVLFVASSGTRAAPAVLYAIDAGTGKELWNSGKSIASPVRGGLSGGQGNVYVPGANSTLYAFGFGIEK